MNIERQTIFWAEVEADIYQPEGKLPTKHFHAHAEGDKDSDRNEHDIIFKVSNLPPGARITLSYPNCPNCGFFRMDKLEFKNGMYQVVGHEPKCECGFDWEEWVQDTYS
jgi:hypothetical protein